MSYLEAEGLSKTELKNRLTQMGMSLDKYDHPKDYYMQLYLDKYNAKNKVTRDNAPFYKEQVLLGKRERDRSYDAQNYDEVEYEEEDEGNNYGDDDDEDYVYEESEESNENKVRRRRKKAKTIKFDEKNFDYRESGIKNIRLIRSKKKKILRNKAREGNEQNNVKKNIFVVSVQDQKAGQNSEYYTNNYNNNYRNENTQGLNENNGQQYQIKNNEYNVYSNNILPDDKRKMIQLKVEKLYCDGDQYYKRNENENETNPNNYNRKENQYYGVEIRENYNQNLRSNNNNSANSKNNSNKYFTTTQHGNSSGKGSQKYNFFIRNITQTVKDDLKNNQMSSKSKNVLVNSNSMNQMEGHNEYNNSINNLRSSPYQEDMNMNNQEVVEFPRILKGKNKEVQDQELFTNLPKEQIVSESIKETKIMGQYNNSQAGNAGSARKDNNYEYKKKLRSYSKNNGSNLPETDNDYNNNNYSQNININYVNDKINSLNQNYDNDNNIINTDLNQFNNNENREQYMTNYENMDNNIRGSNNFNNNSNKRNSLTEFNSSNYNIQNNVNDNNGAYESNPNDNNYSGYNSQNNLNVEQRKNYSNNYNNQIDTNNRSNLNEFNSGNYNTQSNMNDTNHEYEINPNNSNNFNEEHRMDYSNNFSNNQNDLNQYGGNLDQRIRYSNNENNNSILNSNILDKNDNYNNNNNNNQFSEVINANSMNNNYGNGDDESAFTDNQSRFSFWNSGRNLKNNLMEKFKKYIYLFPLILLIAFGIAYFYSGDEFRTTIIYSFSAIMGLLVLYLLFKYIKDKKRYKQMAREDREELLNELQRRNITSQNLANNTVFLNNFIEKRIQHHKVNQDEYINYVFPYLQKFLKKDRLELCKDQEENPISYWIEI